MRRRRKGKTLGAEPEPHLSGRTHFCELFEDAADGVGDRLVGMEEHFAVVVAPDKPDGKSPSELPLAALLRMPPSSRARITWSSASAIVPFRPRSNRSLKSPGW